MLRYDDFEEFSISADYKMRRWLNLGAGYTYQVNDSNVSADDYDRNIFIARFIM